MAWDVALALLAFVSQFATAYLGWRVTVDGVKQERKKLCEAIFALGGIVGAIAIGTVTYRSNGIATDLEGIKKQLSGATVALVRMQLVPSVQPLIPSREMQVEMMFGVDEGTAKGMQCWFDAFTLPGDASTEQNRQAISRFRQAIAKGDQPSGEDRITGSGCRKQLLVKLNESEIAQLVEKNGSVNRILYGMGRAQWKNDAGADFHTEVCKWMEPPKSFIVNSPGWHDCAN
jgi:hypothetical protein